MTWPDEPGRDEERARTWGLTLAAVRLSRETYRAGIALAQPHEPRFEPYVPPNRRGRAKGER